MTTPAAAPLHRTQHFVDYPYVAFTNATAFSYHALLGERFNREATSRHTASGT
jgi:hypothetical protein